MRLEELNHMSKSNTMVDVCEWCSARYCPHTEVLLYFDPKFGLISEKMCAIIWVEKS